MLARFPHSFFILFFLICFEGNCQQYNFRNYSISEGLAQSQVYSICEDKFGNIWFGTRGGGLSRFDGITFTNYSSENGLADNYINSIEKDSNGNLWIATDNGLSFFNGKNFKNYGIEQGLYNTRVNAVLTDIGKTWIGTDKGIFILEKDTIVRFGRKSDFPAEKIRCFYKDKNNTLWVGTDFGAYSVMGGGNNWIIRSYTTKSGLGGNIITSIFPENDKLWFCSYGGGATMYDGKVFHRFTMANGLAGNTVFCGLQSGSKSLWLGTSNGASLYFPEQDSTINFTITQGLSNNVILSMYKDSFGNIWFGTSGGGVSKLGSERFIHFPKINEVLGEWSYSVFEDNSGNIWFGSSEGGVTKFDGKSYRRYYEKDGFTSSKVRHIHQDNKGNLWFGTIADGAFRFDGNHFEKFSRNNGLSSNFINFINSDSNGVFLGTAGGGLNFLEEDTLKKSRITILKPRNGLGSDRINSIQKDENGNWFIGTAGGGITRLTPIKDGFLVKTLGKKEGLASNTIRCIVADKSRIILGTADAGIIILKGNKQFRIDRKSGLSSDNIYALVMDSKGNLWAGTEKGIDRITLKNDFVESVRHYGKAEGFKGIEVMQNCAFEDRSGNLWFGTVDGITKYAPEKDFPFKAPLIIITGIQLFFDKIENTPYGKNNDQWYAIPSSLELPFDKNHLSFSFIGIEQNNPEAVRYLWKLDGFDETWSPLTARREAVYSNLPPGNYTFRVKAANESGIWSVKEATFSFTIHPPFWGTWWFRISISALILFCIWFIVSIRYRRLRKQNLKEREALQQERHLLELEQKALRLQMNPHFLFNCLNSIKGIIAEDKPEEAKLYISKFSKLMRAMLENSRQEFIDLKKEIELISNYIDLENISASRKIEYKIDIDENIDQSSTAIPPMFIQPFVENAIVHGLMPKKENGRVIIDIKRESKNLKITIEDNGVGRSNANEKKRQSGDINKSSALAITQERLNFINKKLNSEEVQIKIIDLADVNGNPSGTRIEVITPFITL